MSSKFFTTLLSLLLLSKVNSQVASPLQTFANPELYDLSDKTCLNLNGEWLGEETEFYDDFKHEKGRFSIRFNLNQQGNCVTGTSYISFNNGASYGLFKIRGLVRGNKFYFEEYEIIEQKFTEANAAWCLRTGELDIVLSHNKIILEGANYKGYVAYFYYNCAVAVSMTVSKNISAKQAEEIKKNNSLRDDYSMQMHPNPANMEVTVSFKIPEDLNVRVELFSLSGELIGTVTNELYTAGFHQKLFSLHTYPAGAYLIRMQAGNQSFAKTLVIAR